MEESDAIITSPPYSHSETETGGEKGKRGGDSRQRVKKDYAEVSEGNIGLLTHGEVDSIVTSPPFGPSTRGGGIFKEGYTAPGEEEVSDPGLPERHSRPLSDDPRNIDNLEYGEVDAVVTSPPYGNRLADDVVQDGDEARMSYRQAIDSIVTSPPYEEGLRHRGQNYEEVREKLLAQGYSEEYIRASWSQPHQCQRWAEEAYGEDERNIGNLKSESYLEAMLQCYREFYKVLKNPIDWCECGPTERSIKTRIETLHCVSHATRGFIMKYKVCPQCGKPQKPEDYNKNPLKHKPCLILVTKNFIRDKQVVRLDEDTIRLCEAAGFRLSDRWYFKLPQRSFWRILYKRRYPDVPEVEYEDVLVFKKESMLSRA
uniref:site-specific DNA-methyltransferase (cytosine-N(4)-specific) n=1 Tax=viral metagenome TaxID=1070528 RepID=A0A6M3MB26_9ZZZZ